MTDLRQALAQGESTSDSATRSADSADSFCKQELHSLMSVAGRMALELECLLLDTKDLSVVSKWWDTGMESLQAYRDYIWSITHGKEEIIALAQGEREPVAWVKEGKERVGFGRIEERKYVQFDQTLPVGTKLYTSQPSKPWVSLTDEEIGECIKKADYNQGQYKRTPYWAHFATAIEAALKEKNT